MNHLETLIAEYLEWSGHFVVRQKKVGRRAQGGWEMEFDVVAFNTATGHVLHYEPSSDTFSWAKREARYAKKFAAAQKYIESEVLPHVEIAGIRHIAVMPDHPRGRDTLSGFELMSIAEMRDEIVAAIKPLGKGRNNAVPERFPLLRTIQLVVSGY